MELKEQMEKLEGEMKTLKEALSQAQGENARLREAAIIAEAGQVVLVKLAEAKLPDVTKARLAPVLSANPPVKDGVLDKMALESAIGTAITAESEYISKLVGDVKVRGMGEPADAPVGDKAKEAFLGMYRSMGKSADEAKRLAELSV